MIEALAPSKINLALVVGPPREDGKHEVVTVMQSLALSDRLILSRASALVVTGFEDTLVTRALRALAAAGRIEPRWAVELEKHIPVAAGLGGGSSDAGTALALANDSLPEPLPPARLSAVAAGVGADVPFFLCGGSQLATGDGTVLERIALPLDYWVLLVLPHSAAKASTGDVYRRFDECGGADGFGGRRDQLRHALEDVRDRTDLALLPPNDLVSSPVASRLRELGAFRADVSGAGPCVYGLFHDHETAAAAAILLANDGTTWLTTPTLGADKPPRLPPEGLP